MKIFEKDENGFYTCTFDESAAPYHSGPHTFYKLGGLIPLDDPLMHASSYIDSESHWLAIWDSKIGGKSFVLEPEDIVKIKIRKISAPAVYGHVANARDISVKDNLIQILKK